jgi:DNA gyrase subunit B
VEMINTRGLREDMIDDSDKLLEYSNNILILLDKYKFSGCSYQSRVESDEEAGSRIVITRRIHGLDHEYCLDHDFLTSSDYRLLSSLGDKLDSLLGDGAYVERNDKQCGVSRFSEVMVWLMEQARKGQNIQRYKGLGEMNPDQLWDTTMNPETRRMLQVRIEDVIAADEVFTTLMGDQVEPRRDFIEQNALHANNIDT